MLHNVRTALAAFSKSCVFLDQRIDAANIVDGHREETLKLLWEIVTSWNFETVLDMTCLQAEVLRLRFQYQERFKRPSNVSLYAGHVSIILGLADHVTVLNDL